jgi:alpha-glucoside transport system substrate-binding protein
MKRNKYWSAAALLAIIAMLAAACAPAATATTAPTVAPTSKPADTAVPATSAPAGGIDCMGAKSGDKISLLYQWSGAEEESLNAILKPLVDACGIVLAPEASRDQALLDTRVQAGTPPDIAFAHPTQLILYKDKLKALDTLGGVKANYSDVILAPGVVDGKWLGLPVKADIKSIIWYDPAVFDAKGYTVPKTWDELNTLVEKMVADGNVPWSMGLESGPATGWTGSDFIQDILLVQKGPQYVEDIISGKVAYSDAGVKAAYETYGKWAKDPKYAAGGAQGTLSTAFGDAIYLPFDDPPKAMMVKQSGFAGGEVKKKFADLNYGTDYAFFQGPGVQGLQGGADWMMAFSDSAATKALVAYLSSTTGGENWAKQTFGLTPNSGGAGKYADPTLKDLGDLLASPPGPLVPDIGDSIPGGFGQAEWTAIINYINDQDLDTQLKAAAQAQADALK